MLTNQTQTAEPAQDRPAIAALPEPTLESQLELLKRERDDLESLVIVRNKEIVLLKEDADGLKGQLAFLETNPIFFALNNLDYGSALTAAGDDFVKMIAAVRDKRKAGKINIVIAAKMMEGTDDTLIVGAMHTITMPKGTPPVGTFFADEDGKLSREPSNQRELALEREEKRRMKRI